MRDKDPFSSQKPYLLSDNQRLTPLTKNAKTSISCILSSCRMVVLPSLGNIGMGGPNFYIFRTGELYNSSAYV